MSWRCLFGRHNWVRIGSAPSEITVHDHRITVWGGPKGTNRVPMATKLHGFVILVECRDCGREKGYDEYVGKRKRHSAAYARSFIEKSPAGQLRKGEP